MLNLIGFVLPPFIDLLNRKVPNSNLRYLISLAICLVLGALLNWQKLSVGSADGFFMSAGLIFAEAQSVYKLYWGNSGARASLNLKS